MLQECKRYCRYLLYDPCFAGMSYTKNISATRFEGEYGMKKIMILGASYLQTFIIKKVQEMGLSAIVLDGNPNSEGFAIADKYYVCSTTDLEQVLEIAKKEDIDGILTYASDVAAPTVAYVADKLGLPGDPYESVCIMTDKAKTRAFLKENGFNVPDSIEVHSYEEAVRAIEEIGLPVMVKPVDSSGSKGVSKVNELDELSHGFSYAKSFSRSGRVIVEQFIKRKGYQVDADCFLYDGELKYFNPMDQHQDVIAPYSPIGISGPSVSEAAKAEEATNEVRRMLQLLNMRFGAYNVEYIFDEEDRLYILEIGPRSGGNLIPDVIQEGVGIDLRRYLIKACLGESCSDVCMMPFSRNVTSFIVHSQEDGLFVGLDMDPVVRDAVVFQNLFVKEGDPIKRFSSGIDAIGFCLLKFDDLELMLNVLDHSADYIRVKVRKPEES